MSKTVFTVLTGLFLFILVIVANYSYERGYNKLGNVSNQNTYEVKKQPVNINAQAEANIIEMGRKLHLSILDGHKKIDPYYREPYIFGGFSPNPQCCIAVPISDWKTLSENEKKSLKTYAASLIPTVKSQPLKYANINSNAPIAPKIKDNVLKMSGDSWNIMLGDVSSNGKDISPDMYVR